MSVTSTKFLLLYSRPTDRNGTDDYLSFSEMQLRASAGGATLCVGGTAVASRNSATALFDGNPTSYHQTVILRTSGFAGYDFGASAPKSVVELAVRNRDTTSLIGGIPTWEKEAPRNLLLTAIDSVTGDHIPCSVQPNVAWTTNSQLLTFPVSPAPANTVYRIRGTSFYSSGSLSYFDLAEVEMATSPGGASIYNVADTGVFSPLYAANDNADCMEAVDGSTAYSNGTFSAAVVGSSALTNNDPKNHWLAFAWESPKDIVEVRLKTSSDLTQYVRFPNTLVVEVWDGAAWVTRGTLDVTTGKAAGQTYVISLGAARLRTTQFSASYALGAAGRQVGQWSAAWRVDAQDRSIAYLTAAASIGAFVRAPSAALFSASYRLQVQRDGQGDATAQFSSSYGLEVYAEQQRALLDVTSALQAYTPATRLVSASYVIRSRAAFPALLGVTYALATLVPAPAPMLFQTSWRVHAFARAISRGALDVSYAVRAWESGSRFLDVTYALRTALAQTGLLTVLYSLDARQEARTWAANATTGAVSRFSGYDFLGYAEIGGVLYGIAEDGVYRLDGPPVLGSILTKIVDFRDATGPVVGRTDSRNLKRVSEVYLGAQDASSLTARVWADGVASPVYPAADANPQLHSVKIPVGRGLRGRYWQIEIGGITGLDTADVNLTPTTNRVK
jgi:hypothetical protein